MIKNFSVLYVGNIDLDDVGSDGTCLRMRGGIRMSG